MRIDPAALLASVFLVVGSSGVAFAGLATSPAWSGDSYSQSLAVADVNGDGFADVIVGAPDETGTKPKPWYGRVSVYLGSASGLSTTPDQQLINPSSTISNFGYSVAGIGDFDGDGFEDVAISEPGYKGQGAVHVYLGSRSGLPNKPSWTALGDRPSCCGFGSSVSSAGDVNGDGFADLIVGNPYFSSGGQVGNNQGQAYLYYGSRGHAQPRSAWTYVSPIFQDLLGNKVAGAGDVNADGFADLLVAEPGFTGPNNEGGRVLLFLGSAQGPGANPSWSVMGELNGVIGSSIASAGDVNGDGHGDIVIGNSQAPGGGQKHGKAFVWFGSATGLSTAPDWTVIGDVDFCWLGWSVSSAGDVNGDGFDDVLVGAAYRIQTIDQRGRAYLYLGGATGPSVTPDWFYEGQFSDGHLGWDVSGRDMNGDGFSDALVGAQGYRTVHLFLGQP